MRLEKSLFNMALFKKNISRTWLLGLAYVLALTIIMPIQYLLRYNYNVEKNGFVAGYTPQMDLTWFMADASNSEYGFGIAIVVVAITFWYLFNKRDSYMMHAFPVSRRSLFFTGLLTCIIVSFVPVLLISIIMSIIGLATGGAAYGVIWYWAFTVLVSTLLFISIALFAMMCTGQLITAICFYVGINFLCFLMEAAFRMLAKRLMLGLGYIQMKHFNALTPLIFIKNACDIKVMLRGSTEAYDYIDIQYGSTWYLFAYLAASVVITIVAYILYKRKQNETVHEFIAVPLFKPLFTIGASFFIPLVLACFASSFVFKIKYEYTYGTRFAVTVILSLVLGVAFFFANQMMIEKTFRVFNMKKIIQCAAFTLLSLVIFMCFRLDVANIEGRVPESEDIEWAAIQGTYSMVFTDADDINKVREVHNNLLKDKGELRDLVHNSNRNNKYEPYSELTFKYKLKNGEYLVRVYEVIDTEAEAASATYLSAVQPVLDFINKPEVIKEHVLGNIWDDCTVKDVSISNITKKNGAGWAAYAADFDITKSQMESKNKRVYNALLKDIDDGNLFITHFGDDGFGYDYNITYYNDFSLIISNQREAYFSDESTFKGVDLPPIYEQTINASLNTRCENTIDALIEEGFLESKDSLIKKTDYQSYYDSTKEEYESR